MITSADNKQVKEIVKLLSSSKHRRETGLFVIEGEHLFKEVPDEALEKVYASEDFKDESGRLSKLVKERPECVERVTAEVFKKMSDTLTPQGVLCVVKRSVYTVDEMISDANEKRLFVVLEGIQDPGNLGTIMRTAEGAGASGVIMSRDTVDIYNPKTVRSTMGSIFRVPFVYEEDLKGSVDKLKKAGITCYAAHLKGKKTYKEFDYSKGAAFFIGNEGNGLSDETAGLCDEYLLIPMCGKLESLNAAVSAAILMYQV